MILLPYGYKSGKILLADLDPEHYITNQKAVVSKLTGSVWNTPIVPIYSNESLELSEDEYTELTADWVRYQEFLANNQEPIEKADSYKPTAGMVTAAKRALRWKEEGKAKGAGTPVGWGRATDIASGRTMSLDVVKRMFSFFSRHEVDKKGKDFDNISEPSNGRIMWDAWGGDAGFTWSRTIVEREKKKVEKHGSHDQTKHGRPKGGKMGAGVADSILERVRAEGGLSVKMTDGSEPTTGYMVAKGPQYGAIASAADFYDPQKGPKILADYMKANKADLATGKNYLGLWHEKKEGKVYLDVSENVLDLDDAKQRGQSRDQISIWDVANFEPIDTGGTGNVGKNRGHKFAQFVRNDGRGDRGLRTNSLEQAGKTPDASNHSKTVDITIPIKYRLGKVLLGELTNGMFITKNKIPVYKNSLLSVSELDLLPYWGSEKIELTNGEYNEMTRSYFLTLKRADPSQ